MAPALTSTDYFGDGSDGSVVINTSTTLQRDMYYTDLTVNATLNANGYKIFARGLLTLNGTISNNGGNATGNTGGAAGAAGTLGGGTAGTSGAVGTNGNGGVAVAPTSSKGYGGDGGGGGGAGQSGGGGQDGGPATPGTPVDEQDVALLTPHLLRGAQLMQGGTGGRGGSSGYGTSSVMGGNGGGGGGGAGIIAIFARRIVIAGGTVSAQGGAGAAGSQASGAGAGGAGGQGGGGLIYLCYEIISGETSATYQTALNGRVLKFQRPHALIDAVEWGCAPNTGEDMTAALNQLFADLQFAQPSPTVVIAPGEYVVSASISAGFACNIEATGAIFKFTPPDDVTVFSWGVAASPQFQNNYLRGLKVIRSAAPTESLQSRKCVGIEIRSTVTCLVDSCTVENCATGFLVRGAREPVPTGGTGNYDNTLLNLVARNCRFGIHVASTNAQATGDQGFANDNTFVGGAMVLDASVPDPEVGRAIWVNPAVDETQQTKAVHTPNNNRFCSMDLSSNWGRKILCAGLQNQWFNCVYSNTGTATGIEFVGLAAPIAGPGNTVAWGPLLEVTKMVETGTSGNQKLDASHVGLGAAGLTNAHVAKLMLDRMAVSGSIPDNAVYVEVAANVTLPSASQVPNHLLIIRNTGTSSIAVSRAGSDTIDGATSITLSGGAAVWLYSGGFSAWFDVT